MLQGATPTRSATGSTCTHDVNFPYDVNDLEPLKASLQHLPVAYPCTSLQSSVLLAEQSCCTSPDPALNIDFEMSQMNFFHIVTLVFAPSLYIVLSCCAFAQFSLIFNGVSSLAFHMQRQPALEPFAPCG